MFVQQKVQLLLRGIKGNDIQFQTTMGIIRDRYLNDFDSACITLLCTVLSCYASSTIQPGRNNCFTGAATSNLRNTCGGRGRIGSCSSNCGSHWPKVMMNGVDVLDVHRNFTSDEWHTLCLVGGHAYISQRRKYLTTCGSGCFDGRGRGGRGSAPGYTGHGGRSLGTEHRPNDLPRTIAAAEANNFYRDG